MVTVSNAQGREISASLHRHSRSLQAPHIALVVQPIVPDKNLTVVIARSDSTTFGILHSRFHELWSLGLCTWLGVGNDPRYTPTTTF